MVSVSTATNFLYSGKLRMSLASSTHELGWPAGHFRNRLDADNGLRIAREEPRGRELAAVSQRHHHAGPTFAVERRQLGNGRFRYVQADRASGAATRSGVNWATDLAVSAATAMQ
jgi:hypothetical protein